MSQLALQKEPRLLAGKMVWMDTLLTYHRTWETGLDAVTRVTVSNPLLFFRIFLLLPATKIIPRGKYENTVSCFFVDVCHHAVSNVAFAAEAASSRLQAAATVLDEIMAAPDKGIPSDILSSAKCVAIIPSLLKGGFVVGGAHGRGMATCRTATGWSAPAPLTTTGGSIGLQIGGQAVDVVMVVMNDRGMQALLTSKFKLGADASVAAGPVGRQTEGSTDWKLRAEVLTYSRARGLFAGISFNGAVIKQDEDATGELYGRMVDFKSILTGSVQPPQSADAFLAAIRKAVGTDTAPPSTPARSTFRPIPLLVAGESAASGHADPNSMKPATPR